MLLETKGPRQQTKFDPKSGRGLRSRDHFYNHFWNHHISVMAQDKISKFDLLSEINGPMWFTKFDP